MHHCYYVECSLFASFYTRATSSSRNLLHSLSHLTYFQGVDGNIVSNHIPPLGCLVRKQNIDCAGPRNGRHLILLECEDFRLIKLREIYLKYSKFSQHLNRTRLGDRILPFSGCFVHFTVPTGRKFLIVTVTLRHRWKLLTEWRFPRCIVPWKQQGEKQNIVVNKDNLILSLNSVTKWQYSASFHKVEGDTYLNVEKWSLSS